MRFVVEEAQDLTIPEGATLQARLIEVKEHEFSWTNRQGETEHGDTLEWWFEITDASVEDGKYVGRRVRGNTDTKITVDERNKFRAWFELLSGKNMALGVGGDTDDLIGLSCLVNIGHQVDKKDPSRVYERVTSLFALGAPVQVPF